MFEQPDGFRVGNLYSYPNPQDTSTFFYLPDAPTPELTANGKPTLNLWVSGHGATLQLGTQWSPDSSQLLTLKQEIARRYSLDPSLIRLVPAPISVEQVTLTIVDSQGNHQELETVDSSGYPPFTALFQVSLNDTQKAQAVAALSGRKDVLTVCYHLLFRHEVTIQAAIAGDVKTEIAALSAQATQAECLTQIERALTEGHLQMQLTNASEVPEELRQKVSRRAKEKAAIALQRLVKSFHSLSSPSNLQSTLKVATSLSETLLDRFTQCTDVSCWFTNDSGMDYIQTLTTL